jgi:hypothetical protein
MRYIRRVSLFFSRTLHLACFFSVDLNICHRNRSALFWLHNDFERFNFFHIFFSLLMLQNAPLVRRVYVCLFEQNVVKQMDEGRVKGKSIYKRHPPSALCCAIKHENSMLPGILALSNKHCRRDVAKNADRKVCLRLSFLLTQFLTHIAMYNCKIASCDIIEIDRGTGCGVMNSL